MQVFAGQPLTIPRISLISSAETITPATDRWFGGYDVEQEGLPEGGTFEVCPPSDSLIVPNADNGSIGQFTPYEIYATDKCSTFHEDRDRFGRATRKLLAIESSLIEAHLWSDPDGLGNPNLAGEATDLAGAAVSAVNGLRRLEQALADADVPRGMVHVRPGILTLLVKDGVIRREGNVYLTAMDNLVVPGRGYAGTGPAAQAVTSTSEWMYASSGIVVVRRGEITYTPRKDDPQFMQTDWRTNDILVRASRIAHAALDTSGVTYAVQINPTL